MVWDTPTQKYTEYPLPPPPELKYTNEQVIKINSATLVPVRSFIYPLFGTNSSVVDGLK